MFHFTFDMGGAISATPVPEVIEADDLRPADTPALPPPAEEVEIDLAGLLGIDDSPA